MRISDWSSDVCSSDLAGELLGGANRQRCHHARDIRRRRQVRGQERLEALQVARDDLEQKVDFAVQHIAFAHFGEAADIILERLQVGFGLAAQADHRKDGDAIAELRGIRSEEHTSELQSLMRISYAVFCLKKKNTTIAKILTLK